VWLPVPERSLRTAKVTFHVQADSGERAIANGKLVKVDTLAYGHTVWTYEMDRTVPLTMLAAAAGPYVVIRVPLHSCNVLDTNPTYPCPASAVYTWSRDSAFAASGPFRRAAEIADYFAWNLGPRFHPTIAHVEAAVPHVLSGASVVLYPEAALRDHTLDEATVVRETARQWLRPNAPDSVADYLARLWASDTLPNRQGKLFSDRLMTFRDHILSPEELAPVRAYLLKP
jgi:hypothetical protein